MHQFLLRIDSLKYPHKIALARVRALGTNISMYALRTLTSVSAPMRALGKGDSIRVLKCAC